MYTYTGSGGPRSPDAPFALRPDRRGDRRLSGAGYVI